LSCNGFKNRNSLHWLSVRRPICIFPARRPYCYRSEPQSGVRRASGSLLYHLPLELRQEIYFLALATLKFPFLQTFKNHRITPDHQHFDKAVSRPIALLAVCRRIRLEASPIFYRQTHFWEATHARLSNILSHAISQDLHLHIRHICLLPFDQYTSPNSGPARRHHITWPFEEVRTSSPSSARLWYSRKAIITFLDHLAAMPSLRNLELPHDMTPLAPPGATPHGWEMFGYADQMLDIMTTLRANDGVMRIFRAYGRPSRPVVNDFLPWRHYEPYLDTNDNPFLVLAAVEIRAWEQLLELDVQHDKDYEGEHIFDEIYDTAHQANMESLTPMKHISVRLESWPQLKAFARIYGLPKHLWEEKVKAEESARMKAHRRSLKEVAMNAKNEQRDKSRRARPALTVDNGCDEDDEESMQPDKGRSREAFTREEARLKKATHRSYRYAKTDEYTNRPVKFLA
jgi:hypothetical protein